MKPLIYGFTIAFGFLTLLVAGSTYANANDIITWDVEGLSSDNPGLIPTTPIDLIVQPGYRGEDDHPFPRRPAGVNFLRDHLFFLPKFELGRFSAPGLSIPAGLTPADLLLDPAHSVDEDDGVIDGVDSGGSSIRSDSTLIGLDTAVSGIVFDVDFSIFSLSLGDLTPTRQPTHFGFVLTNAHPDASWIALTLEGESGTLYNDAINNPLGEIPLGGTQDDVFIGAILSEGIKRVSISVGHTFSPSMNVGGELPRSDIGFNIDHLLYGYTIPEPTTGLLLAIGLFATACAERWRA